MIAAPQPDPKGRDAWTAAGEIYCHALGAMRSARAAKALLLRGEGDAIVRIAFEDCVKSARRWRRVAQAMRREDGR